MQTGQAKRLCILSVGHGGRAIDEFMALLKRHTIRYLIDVRSQPYSRYQPHFGRESLAAALEAAGIRYVFMGQQLGGRPDDPTAYTNGFIDYEKCRKRPWFCEGIERLRRTCEQRLPVALMCSEAKPEHCHRAKLIGRVLEEESVVVWHIDEDGELRTQQEIMRRLDGGQRYLFGLASELTRSRRNYRPDSMDRQSD